MKRIEKQAGKILPVGGLLPGSGVGGGVTSWARRVAAGENVGKAAVSTAGNYVADRVGQQGRRFASQVSSRLPVPDGQLGQQFSRLPLPSFEVSGVLPPPAKTSGMWKREGNRILLIGVSA